MTQTCFKLQDVSFSYGDRPVLSGLDFSLEPGERVALIGGNGVGKSTLLHLLVGLQTPQAGTLEAFGKVRRTESDFYEVRARAGLLFQDPDDQLFCPTVLEDVAFGPLNLGKSQNEAVEIALRTLSELGLENFAPRITHKLSGGEKRMVSLASVLAMAPLALLLDEPTGGLDETASERLMEHLLALPQAMVFVSHDRAFVERIASRAVQLVDGRLAKAEIHAHPHTHVHSHLHVHAPGMADHTHDNGAPSHLDHEHEAHGTQGHGHKHGHGPGNHN